MIAVRIGCLVGLIGACLAPPAALAATVEGQPFDDVIRLGSSELVLNGVGVRAVLIFKGYVAALYLSEKSTTRSAVSQTIGSKRLQLRMLRRASAQDFLNALVPGIHQNVDAKELSRLGERINQMERIISGIGNTEAGDVIDFDFSPHVGTTVALNGVRKGVAIVGADFYDAVLGIFVGTNPVDERLKRGLLGLPE